jgi:hypothetical protein
MLDHNIYAQVQSNREDLANFKTFDDLENKDLFFSTSNVKFAGYRPPGSLTQYLKAMNFEAPEFKSVSNPYDWISGAFMNYMTDELESDLAQQYPGLYQSPQNVTLPQTFTNENPEPTEQITTGNEEKEETFRVNIFKKMANALGDIWSKFKNQNDPQTYDEALLYRFKQLTEIYKAEFDQECPHPAEAGDYWLSPKKCHGIMNYFIEEKRLFTKQDWKDLTAHFGDDPKAYYQVTSYRDYNQVFPMLGPTDENIGDRNLQLWVPEFNKNYNYKHYAYIFARSGMGNYDWGYGGFLEGGFQEHLASYTGGASNTQYDPNNND